MLTQITHVSSLFAKHNLSKTMINPGLKHNALFQSATAKSFQNLKKDVFAGKSTRGKSPEGERDPSISKKKVMTATDPVSSVPSSLPAGQLPSPTSTTDSSTAPKDGLSDCLDMDIDSEETTSHQLTHDAKQVAAFPVLPPSFTQLLDRINNHMEVDSETSNPTQDIDQAIDKVTISLLSNIATHYDEARNRVKLFYDFMTNFRQNSPSIPWDLPAEVLNISHTDHQIIVEILKHELEKDLAENTIDPADATRHAQEITNYEQAVQLLAANGHLT